MSEKVKASEDSGDEHKSSSSIPLSASDSTICDSTRKRRSSRASHHHHSEKHSRSRSGSEHNSDDESAKKSSSSKSKKESSDDQKHKHRKSSLRKEESLTLEESDESASEEETDIPPPPIPPPSDDGILPPPVGDIPPPPVDDIPPPPVGDIPPPPVDDIPPPPPPAFELDLSKGDKPVTPKGGLRMPFHQLDSTLVAGRRACSLSPVAHQRTMSMNDITLSSERSRDIGNDKTSTGSNDSDGAGASPRFQAADTTAMKTRRRSGLFLSTSRVVPNDSESVESPAKDSDKESTDDKRRKKSDDERKKSRKHSSRHHHRSSTSRKVSSYMLPIAHGWYEGLDPKGRKYYLNRRLKITQWDVPDEIMLLLPPLPHGWEERKDQGGKRYYVNMQLKKSQRGRPSPRDPELKAMMKEHLSRTTSGESKSTVLVVTPPSPRSPVSPDKA